MAEIERPDLSAVPLPDLIGMMLGCSMSRDPSDKAFAKFCRDEIAKRKIKPSAHDDIGESIK